MSAFHCSVHSPVSVRRYRLPYPALAFLLLVLSHPARAAGITADVDKTAIALNEPVELTLEVTGDPGIHPDLSVLNPDFQIVDRRTSHQVSIVNGERSERRILVLRLLPRRPGELTLPAISYGDTATAPLRLSVTASPSAPTETQVVVAPALVANEPAPTPTVVLEADLTPDRVYTAQELVLTAKVFMDGLVQHPRLHDPQVSGSAMLPLGEDHYEAQRDGRSFQVYERRYAIFPRTSGRMEIAPLLFEAWAPKTGGIQPGMGFATPEHHLSARSGALAADVLSPAAGVDPETWLPARSLSLSESGPETYRTYAGRSITRRIGLRADGIMSARLPKLAMPVPHQLTTSYGQPRLWDERRPEGVIGTRQETVTLTAAEPGHYRLPPLNLDWWNTVADRWETAMLPARELVVSAGPAPDTGYRQPVTNVAPEPPQPAARPDHPQEMGEAPERVPETRSGQPGAEGGLWTWIAVVLGFAWLATMVGWWRSRRRTNPAATATVPAEPPPTQEEADPLQSEIEAVRAAYESGNAGAAREALIAWAQQALPGEAPSNLARLAQRCTEPLRGQILLLEEAFFSPGPVAWDDQPVWERLRGFVPAPPDEPASFRRGKPIRRRAPNPDAE